VATAVIVIETVVRVWKRTQTYYDPLNKLEKNMPGLHVFWWTSSADKASVTERLWAKD